jgi:AcrR family transcriptional regulator
MYISSVCYLDSVSPKIGKNEESRERSRAALLQAGADLMVEGVLRNPFASLRLRAICERAGYSTGAFYLHWDTLDEYYNDLAEQLSSEESFDADMAELEEVGERNAEASTLTAITRVADRDIELLVSEPLYDAMELLTVTWGRTRLREQSAHAYKVFDHDIGQAYGTILAKRGREPRPPLDWDRIGAMLQALIEGFTLRHKVDPTAAPLSSEADLSPYATAVAAVLAVTTRSADDTANLREAIHALIDGYTKPPKSDPREKADHPDGATASPAAG